MGAFYTVIYTCGVTALLTTFTHNLGITPSLLVARAIPRGVAAVATTTTTALLIGVIGTNIITVCTGGTLNTFDLEVQQVHSIIN